MNNYLQTLSKKCANKYQNTSHKEDLVSVGVLAALEELDSNPEAQPARLWQVISTAQWKHLNVDCLPVSVPFELVRVVKGLGSVDRGYSKEVLDWATLICSSPQFDSSYHEGDTEANHAEEYAEKALLEDIWEAAKECLTEEEYDLFNYYFQQGMDQEYLAGLLSVSQKTVSLRVSKICEKVQKRIVNK
jgi:RNA polymerase sigma factor (sigma-70 family)